VDLQRTFLGDDLRRLEGAFEIGRVDLRDALDTEPPGGGGRLSSTGRRECEVVVALPAMLAIPVRLAVPNEIEQRHAVILARQF